MNLKFPPGSQQEFQLNCDCNIIRNGAKVKNINDNATQKLITFGISNKEIFLEIARNSDRRPLYKLPVSKARKIINILINEGKITIEFEDSQPIKEKGPGLDISLTAPINNKRILLLISNAVKENVELFQTKLLNYIKQSGNANKLEIQSSIKRKENEIKDESPKNKTRIKIFNNNSEISLLKLPQTVSKQILDFFNKEEREIFKILCKRTSQLYFQFIKTINFSNRNASIEQISKLLLKCSNLQAFSSGQLKNVFSGSILIDSLKNNYVSLQTLDLKDYSKVNDKMVQQIFDKFHNLKCLKLNYFCNVSADTVIALIGKLSNLEELEFYSNQSNSIDHTLFSFSKKLIEEIFLKHLKTFKCYLLDQKFSLLEENALENNSKISKLSLKNIIYGPKTFDLLGKLNLESLKIERIWDPFKNVIQSIPQEKFEILFSNLRNLKELTLGDFCEDWMIYKLLGLTFNLRKLKILSNRVTDYSISALLSCEIPLEKLNLRFCTRINGPCFESLHESTKLLHLEVSFDQHKLNCLLVIIKSLNLSKIKVVNWKKELI